MLSLGCERQQPPPPPPFLKKKKGSGSLPASRSGYHGGFLLIYSSYPDHHQNLISSSLYYSGPLHKISSQSVHMIHQNVRNTSLHISIALKCDYCKPNVPINMKICQFFEKKWAWPTFISCCDMNFYDIVIWLIPNDRTLNRHSFGTLWVGIGKI